MGERSRGGCGAVDKWTALPDEVSHHSIVEAPPREHTVAPVVAGDGSAYHGRAVAMSAFCLCFI